jgi:GNAT superfamily N-acetyltransferase
MTQRGAGITTAEAQWPEVERLFGRGGEPSRCWCRYFALAGPEFSALDPTARKAQLKARFDGGSPAPGVLAFHDGEAVGWCAVEPPSCYPRVLRSRVLRLAEGPEPAEASKNEDAPATAVGAIWSVACFVVSAGHRRSGVAEALLTAAVGHSRRYGAGIVEGYPV